MAEEKVAVATPKRVMTDIARPQTAPKKSFGQRLRRAWKKMDKKRATVILLFVVMAGALVFFINRYQAQQNEIKRLSNPQVVAQQEKQALIVKVGQLTDLPKDETPTIATVSDVSKLKDQAFFASAQNGDKVLIYSQAKQAILYRPSTNKVIQISNVNLGGSQ